jgi:hypothetical protein
VEDRSKDKHLNKNKHDHIQNSDVENVCNSGTTLWNLWEGGKGKENDSISVISHTIRCEGRAIRMCIESCQKKWVVGGKGVKESIRRD